MALEYVRTMLRAFVEQSDGGRPRPSVERPVHLLLIGNGWRLRDLRSAGQSPEAYFEDYSARIVRAFEMAEVVVRPAVIAGIRSGKHWVALGALKCAMVHQAHELASTEPYPVRLPAGRRLTLGGKQLEWPTLVGSGGYELSNEREAKSGAIRCDIQSGPDTPVGWRQQLDQAIPEPRRYPTPDALRELLIASLDYSRLLRGPLQIILERHWKEQL
jgi:hypothetical protein